MPNTSPASAMRKIMVFPSLEVAETLALPEHITKTALLRSPSRKRVEPRE
jgi:hypothetical protein